MDMENLVKNCSFFPQFIYFQLITISQSFSQIFIYIDIITFEEIEFTITTDLCVCVSAYISNFQEILSHELIKTLHLKVAYVIFMFVGGIFIFPSKLDLIKQ